jgi:hypothetical protein
MKEKNYFACKMSMSQRCFPVLHPTSQEKDSFDKKNTTYENGERTHFYFVGKKGDSSRDETTAGKFP